MKNHPSQRPSSHLVLSLLLPVALASVAGAQGTATTYGSSTPGNGNPQIGTNGPPRLGTTGFALELSGAQASAEDAYLLLGSKLDPPQVVAGVTLYVSPTTSVPFTTDPDGTGSVPLPLPGTESLHGGHLYAQFLVEDLGAPGGLAASPGLDVWLGGYAVTPSPPAEPVVPGTTYYANGASGDDMDDGLTPATAFRTLARSLDAMDRSGGDRLVMEGTFLETLDVNAFNPDDLANRPTVFTAARDAAGAFLPAVLDGNCPKTLYEWPFDEDGMEPGISGGNGFLEDGVDIVNSNQVFVSGLRITGFADHAVLTWNSNDVTLSQLETKWVGRNALFLSNTGFFMPPVRDVTVAHCTIEMSNLGRWTNKPTGFSLKSECLTLSQIEGYEVYGNLLKNTFMEGICPKPNSSGSIHHNVVECSRSVGIYANESSDCEITKNIVRNVGWFDDGTGVRLSTAVWQDMWTAAGLYPGPYYVPLQELGATGILVSTGDLGVYPSTGSIADVTITENVVAWTRKNGIVCFNDPSASATMSDVTVENNVIYGACQNTAISAAALIVDATQTTSVFRNNVCANSAELGALINGSGVPTETTLISHTLFFNNQGGNYPASQATFWGTSALVGAPLFVLAPAQPGAADDFRVTAGSPAIDTGASNGLIEVGEGRDRGAQEWDAFAWDAGPESPAGRARGPGGGYRPGRPAPAPDRAGRRAAAGTRATSGSAAGRWSRARRRRGRASDPRRASLPRRARPPRGRAARARPAS